MTHWNPYWILRDKIAYPCNDVLEWARWYETADRRVAFTEIDAEVYVSTVFLGLDQRHGRGDPLLFETMVFGEEKISRAFGQPFSYRADLMQWRYSTWEEAERGHEAACDLIREVFADAQAAIDAALLVAKEPKRS